MLAAIMHVVWYLAGFVLGIGILVKSADWFTEAAVDIARRLHIPEIVVGATIVSLATTCPEFAVSAWGALQGKVDIAVGNAVGSCICNIGLILGLCTLVAPMTVPRKGFIGNSLGAIAVAVLFAGLSYRFPQGSRLTGVVMVIALVAYFAATIRTSLLNRTQPGDDDPETKMSMLQDVTWFLVGAGGVILGSRIVVDCAVGIAEIIGVSQLVISLTVVALGTSMPELVVSLTGIAKKRRGLSIGNVIGANILNLSWVLGVCSLITPLSLRQQTLLFDLPVMLVLSILLLVFGATGERLRRWEGAALFALYMTYLVVVFAVFKEPV